MMKKTRTKRVAKTGGRVHPIALLAIVFTVMVALALDGPAEGSSQCPVIQKENKMTKQPESSEAGPRSAIPPIDLILPVKTKIATFAMA